jgi:hypothetical protein
VIVELVVVENVVEEDLFVDVEFRDPTFTMMGRIVFSAIMLLFASFKSTCVNVVV